MRTAKTDQTGQMNRLIWFFAVHTSFSWFCHALAQMWSHAFFTQVSRDNIRIFHECEVRIEKSVCGSLFGITRFCRVMPNSDPERQIFLSAPNNLDRFFFLHTFWSLAFDFNIGVAINESLSYMLTSAILKFDVICDVTMTSTPNALTTELHDLLHNQRIINTLLFDFVYPTGRIRVCKTRNIQRVSPFQQFFSRIKTLTAFSRELRQCYLS